MKTTYNNETPLVSVLMVTYNHEEFVRDSIEGVLLQKTTFPIELVIGEDASTDQTRAICETIQAEHPDLITLLPKRENMGLKLNFLRTLKACRGKYIAYLEGDDWWITPDKLQKEVEMLEENDDVVLVHTNCKLFNAKDMTYKDHFIEFKGICVRELHSGMSGVIAEFEGRFRPMKTSTVCYRKDTLEEILKSDFELFTNPEFPTQDFQLFQEMCLRGKFAFINEDTTAIGFHDSISAPNDWMKRADFHFGFFKIGVYLIKKYDLPSKVRRVWFRKELYFFFKDAFIRKNNQMLEQVIRLATANKYSLPFTQKLKYMLLEILF